MVNRISATIVADSINEFGNRLTTYVLVFPRIVLAEFNTHRMLSKNSASSRAIPFNVMLDKVDTEPFIPIAFQKEHKGMQGSNYMVDEDHDNAVELWHEARRYAIAAASDLNKFGVTKQLCNRLLEPFLYHTVICTGTEWENFFALRAHPDAEIHIADLADKMLTAYNESSPKTLKAGEWHIPFGDQFDVVRIGMLQRKLGITSKVVRTEGNVNYVDLSDLKVKIATARCARISYLNFEGKDDYENDLRLYKQLLTSGHMSPFEHCAQVMDAGERKTYFNGKADDYDSGVVEGLLFLGEGDEGHEEHFGWCGNFRGFIQHRKMLQDENKTDNRVKKWL